ncbi:MAG TPA: D-lyxose/D-mannose family sugar isomerase, partial [Armatimonadota bacterium]
CRAGQVYLYLPGDPTPAPRGRVPAGREAAFTVWREVILNPGEQYTLSPNTLHWFQAGPEGAVVSEFSTRSLDEADIFTDPAIQRIPEIAK